MPSGMGWVMVMPQESTQAIPPLAPGSIANIGFIVLFPVFVFHFVFQMHTASFGTVARLV
jgi:hypothetical protein